MKPVLAVAAIALAAVSAIVSGPVHAQDAIGSRQFGTWWAIDYSKAPEPSPGCTLRPDTTPGRVTLYFRGTKYAPDVVEGVLTEPGAHFGFKTGFRVDVTIDDNVDRKLPLAATSFNETISFGVVPLERQFALAAILKGALTGEVWKRFTVDLGRDQYSIPLGPDFRQAADAFMNCLASNDGGGMGGASSAADHPPRSEWQPYDGQAWCDAHPEELDSCPKNRQAAKQPPTAPAGSLLRTNHGDYFVPWK